MTLLDDCPKGRSQFLTLKTKETITVDRQTFEHIFALLNACSVNFKYLCDNDIFVFATKNYLASLDNPESGKALKCCTLQLITESDPTTSER